MFDQANVLKNVSKGQKKAAFPMISVAGLAQGLIIHSTVKAMAILKERSDRAIKAAARSKMIDMGLKAKARPTAVTGFEDEARATVELKIKGANQALTSEEVEFLKAKNVPVKTVTKTAETFVINPEYVLDAKLLKKVAKLLSADKSIPADLFLFQEGEEVSVPADEALDHVFETMTNKAEITAVLEVVSTMAIRYKEEK